MDIFTIGFTKRSAENFFETLKQHRIDLIMDIRLRNKSQLAGFTKEGDLRYFLRVICGCDYRHEVIYAPTPEILDGYKKGPLTWADYEEQFGKLLIERQATADFEERCAGHTRVCLLCSEPTPEQCHRRVVAELLMKEHPDWTLTHL